MNLSIRVKAIIALLLTEIIGGIAPISMKIALKELNVYEIIFIRFGIACTLLIPLCIQYAKKAYIKKLIFALPAGILSSGNIFFFVIGLQYTTSIVSQLLYLLLPVIVSLLEYIFFHQRISARRILSIVICFAGSTLLILRSIESSYLIHSIGTVRGNLFIICAVTSWAIYAVYTKRMSKKVEPSFFLITNFLTALIISMLFLGFNNKSLIEVVTKFIHSSTPVIVSLIVLGIVNSIIFFSLYQWSIKHVSTFVVASTAYLAPLSAALFAIPFFGEQLSGVLLLSAASIFIGSYLILTEKK